MIGGDPASPALTWKGHTYSFAGFARLVAGLTPSPVTDISAMTVPLALAHAVAAARDRRAILVHDPAMPAPDCAHLPDGAWLVAATSGSTGTPRAICRSASSWTSSFEDLRVLAGLSPADQVLLTGPLHSTLHLHAALHTLAIGAHLTDLPEHATAMHCVPAVLSDLAATLPAHAPMRRVVVAGALLAPEVADRAIGRGWSVLEYYGSAELSFVATRRVDGTVEADRSMLRPFPGVQVTVDDDAMLWARSPYLALGYLDAGASDGLAPLRRDEQGFVTVGDLVATDLVSSDAQHGFVLRGRGTGVINTGGSIVHAEEVELALESVDGVRAAGVFGIPHHRLGEIVAAAVELEPGRPLAEVRRMARTRLSAAATPRRYVVVDALPRTSTGKLDRAALRTLR